MKKLADLYAVDLGGATWRKSSYTASNGNCVEVTEIPGVSGVAARDSKNIHISPVRVSGPAWAAFVTAVASDTLTS